MVLWGLLGVGWHAVVLWVFASLVVCLLNVLFWLARSVGSDGGCFFFVG